MRSVRSVGRHTLTGTAALTVALAGLAVPAQLAQAAEGITIDPAKPATGQAFTAKATGLDATKTYEMLLTAPGDTNRTSVAEGNQCSLDDAKTTLTCTVTENSAGTYDLKLLSGGTIMTQQAVTVAQTVTPVAPVPNDKAGNADSVTFTYTPGVTWKYTQDNGVEQTVTFAADAKVGDKKDVAITSLDPASDVKITATAQDGFAFAGTAPEYTYRLTGTATVPTAVVIPSAAIPQLSDAPLTADDKVTFTKADGVTWSYSNDGGKTFTPVTFAAGETTRTLAVAPQAGQDYKVVVRATADAGKAFSDNTAVKDTTLTFSNAKAEPAESRIAGSGRVETAAEIAKKYFTETGGAVYVANAMNFPDALAAGPAAARAKAPLLLSYHKTLPDAAKAELQRLQPKEVFVVGGPNVVSDAVVKDLASTGATVRRLEGGNRFGTAADVAGQWASADTVFLANGMGFADALSGGSAAADGGSPLLLTAGGSLSKEASASLARLKPSKVVLVGGANVLSSTVANQVKDVLPGVTVDRVAGSDRYDTSAQIVQKFTGMNGAKSAETLFFATGQNFPDALAGIPAVAKVNGTLALSRPSCLPQSVHDAVTKLADVTNVVRLGDANVLQQFPGSQVCTN